ncbi:MAG: ABC transporter permease [Clostridia bacterium]|nr:ABC transporter permease [Clostridia bacterium]
MVVFVIVPLVLIGVFAFTVNVPYDLEGNRLTEEQASELKLAYEGTDEEIPVVYKTVFSWNNIIAVSQYLPVLLNSAWLALIATLICLVIGYPIAYLMSRVNPSYQRLIQMLIMLPMWMNFLLRTYAWMTLLEKNGWINRILGLVGIGPFDMINTQGAVVLGMIYNYLPFMILPLYSVMLKIQNTTIEAAQDLGAGNIRVFTKVVIPLSMPGIASGITMVFVPAVSTFIISRMLGGGTNMLIGDLIDLQFLGNAYNPNLGAAISLVLMAFILLCMSITNQLDNGDEEMEGKML